MSNNNDHSSSLLPFIPLSLTPPPSLPLSVPPTSLLTHLCSLLLHHNNCYHSFRIAPNKEGQWMLLCQGWGVRGRGRERGKEKQGMRGGWWGERGSRGGRGEERGGRGEVRDGREEREIGEGGERGERGIKGEGREWAKHPIILLWHAMSHSIRFPSPHLLLPSFLCLSSSLSTYFSPSLNSLPSLPPSLFFFSLRFSSSLASSLSSSYFLSFSFLSYSPSSFIFPFPFLFLFCYSPFFSRPICIAFLLISSSSIFILFPCLFLLCLFTSFIFPLISC